MRSARERSPGWRAGLVTLALSLAAPSAGAFCGFYVSGSGEHLYNKATRVALMRVGTRTVLSMSNDYEGPPEDFSLVVPVPVVVARDDVRTLPMDVFDHLDTLTAPRLVQYWEQDPCHPYQDSGVTELYAVTSADSLQEGAPADDTHGVHIEARFTVGEYDVVVLSASASDGLETWLRERQYRIPTGASAWLAPYVRGGWRFFVARVNLARVVRLPDGDARLSPLRIRYDASEFRLPVRLGLLNAPPGIPQDLIVYILHPTARFEVANLPNTFVPTSLEVTEAVAGVFPAFYAGLLDATLQSAGRGAVVTEYAWTTGGGDPCTSPPMDPTELATLGGDALPDFSGSAMVLTRLHTRYNAASLRDDLVFREAVPVAGGRDSTDGDHGARPTTAGNTFQARYAIHHPWTGPVECQHPQRGIWGGPVGSDTQSPTTRAARELASAPRGAIDLPSLVITPNPGVDLRAHLTLPAVTDTPAAPLQTLPATGVRHGCACDAPGAGHAGGPSRWALALTLAGIVRRRRRGAGHRLPRRNSDTLAVSSWGQ